MEVYLAVERRRGFCSPDRRVRVDTRSIDIPLGAGQRDANGATGSRASFAQLAREALVALRRRRVARALHYREALRGCDA